MTVSNTVAHPQLESEMPRALKTDDFFLYAVRRSGHWKNTRMIGVNNWREDLTVQDFIDFLKKKGVSASEVAIPRNFITSAKAKRS